MMSFTDDDLKRLELHGWTWFGDEETALEALLARLKAAEQCAEVYVQDWPNGMTARAWQKAAGKSHFNESKPPAAVKLKKTLSPDFEPLGACLCDPYYGIHCPNH